MRCTLLTALLVQSGAFAPSSAAFAPSSASRGTTRLAAAPYERYLDAACEAAKAAGALIRSASTALPSIEADRMSAPAALAASHAASR